MKKIFNEVWNEKVENYSELVDKSVKSIREKLEEDKKLYKNSSWCRIYI